MITNLDVKRAMNRLANVYSTPKDAEGAFSEWKRILRDPGLNVDPDDLEDAVTYFIRTTEESYGYPKPAQIVALIRAHRTAPGYSEPDEGPRATLEDIRKAWEAADIDLDELRRLNQARKARTSPQPPKPSP